MELKVESPSRRLLPPACVSHLEEKAFSENDDCCNNKHQRRETRSESSERDALEQVLTRPYRRINKTFENGHPYKEASFQSKDMWRNCNTTPLEKDIPGSFEKRCAFPERGRGREFVSWSQHDSSFNSVDISSQISQQAYVPSSLFTSRGMENVSNAQSPPLSAFGLVTEMPNGRLDTLHSLGLQVTLKQSINPSLNIDIQHPRCGDFEERGFCLRGDMCPMEHGINRIVVEDVQSLSQFNLPISLPSANLLEAPAGPAPLPRISAHSRTLMNSKILGSKSSKLGVGGNGLSLNGAFIDSAFAGRTDLYDPDQPLWTNDCSETSTANLSLTPLKVDETVPLLDADPSLDHVELCGVSDYEETVRNSGIALGSQSTSLSVWGRIGSLKKGSEMREKIDSPISSSNYIGKETKEEEPSNTGQGKQIKGDEIGLQVRGSSLKPQSDTSLIMRKPSPKAQRTIYVSGIPQKDNKKEALLSHFRKFGEVIDIRIAHNNERAFVQFSKREEAEAALKAPDAVMGNRFIKLLWAKWDNIPDDRLNSGNIVSIVPCGVTAAAIPCYRTVYNVRKKELQSAFRTFPKRSFVHASVSHVLASDHPKPVVINDHKAPPPLQKKVQSFEVMKEEIRKKQEMLDQKRSDLRRQLDKLEKQATGLKGEKTSEQAAKRRKVETVADVAKGIIPRFTGPGTVISRRSEVMADSGITAETVVPQSFTANAIVSLQEPSSLKQSIRPLAPVGASFLVNRFKLYNAPTTFKIIPPLPTGLANVAALKEHFSTYGDLTTVDLEGLKSQDADDSGAANSSARISFTRRSSAEVAFLNGKCWKGYNLEFVWVASSNSSKDIVGKENSLSSSKGSSDAKVQPAGEVISTDSQRAAISGNGESENLERDSGAELVDPDEDFQSSSSTALLTMKQ